MDGQNIPLEQCKLTLQDNGIVHLHILEGETLEVERIREIFEHIHKSAPDPCALLVTAGEEATLTQEARDLVSSEEITHKVKADAIIVDSLRHEMTANFFIRFTNPIRPTKLFKSEDEARKWLLEKLDEIRDS